MFAQKRKTRFFSTLLYLSIFIAFIAEVNGESWSASWSWPGEERRPRTYLTDEQVIDLLYSRASRSAPDHPSFLERMEFRKEIQSLDDLNDRKEAIERYSTMSNRRNSKTSSYYHRVYH